MIKITLTELDLSLETAELPEFEAILDEHSTVGLQGPIRADLDAMPLEFGYIDLDLLGFPYHGLSAYELAVKNGFIGSLEDWLESLRGLPGGLSPEGLDAVRNAQESAERAGGYAEAAAGILIETQTYSGVAGVHAQASQEAFTRAIAARDETNQLVVATTSIKQQSEAILTANEEVALASIEARVAAETARANAESFRDQSAISQSSAAGSAASASDNATLAVQARDAANNSAEAALLSESSASASATDAANEANAANLSRIQATAARDEAQTTALGVVQEVNRASGYANDSEAFANASRDSSIEAEASNNAAGTSANAAFQSSQTAQAHANQAGEWADAANTSRIQANTSAGQASVSRDQSVQSAADALGYRNTAQDASTTSVQARDASGVHASAALGYRNQAQTFADTAGNIYSAVANRVDVVEAAIGPTGANITETRQIAIDARNRLAEARLRLVVAASGGNPAIFEMFSETAGAGFIRLLASQIFFGENTFFDDATDTFQTLTENGSRLVWGGPFGRESPTNAQKSMIMWLGPAHEAVSNMQRGNGYFWLCMNSPRIGGLDFPVTGGTPPFRARPLPQASRFGSNFSGGNITTNTVTAGVYNWTDPVSYQWEFIGGDSGWVITSPSGAETAFRNNLTQAGQEKRGTFSCLVTNGDGQTDQIIVGAGVAWLV